MKKRLLGIIFSLVLSASLVPATVIAAQNNADAFDKTGVENAYENIESEDVTKFANVVDGDWEYTVTNGTAVIAKYTGTDAAVTVPTRVTLNGTSYNIKSIGANAFKDVQTMTSVIIPKEITSIGAAAFRNCTNLSSITINGNIADCSSYSVDTWSSRDLNNAVFGNVGTNATSLTVTFGPEVTRIPKYLFATGRDEGTGVYAHITDLVIGENVTEIGAVAFFR